MTTGQIIKKLRTERQMSQEQLGDLLGVQRAAVNKYENGTVSNLKRSTIERLSEIFNVSPMYIMGVEKDQPTETDGLTESHRKLIEFARTVPEDKAEKVLKVMQTIVESL